MSPQEPVREEVFVFQFSDLYLFLNFYRYFYPLVWNGNEAIPRVQKKHHRLLADNGVLCLT